MLSRSHGDGLTLSGEMATMMKTDECLANAPVAGLGRIPLCFYVGGLGYQPLGRVDTLVMLPILFTPRHLQLVPLLVDVHVDWRKVLAQLHAPVQAEHVRPPRRGKGGSWCVP